jgi:mannose-6-phosphate isomerase-like protein (cupin superfamily)
MIFTLRRIAERLETDSIYMKKEKISEVNILNELLGKKPASALKGRVLDVLDNLFKEENFDLANPPLLNKYTDYTAWLQAVAHVLPPAEYDNIHLHPIQETPTIQQYVAWAKVGVEDESHDNLKETFLLLEGACRCQIGDSIQDYAVGDIVEIPLHTNHNLQVISDTPVKVILQKVAL